MLGMTELTQLSDSDITALPLDVLGLVALRHIDETGEWNAHNFRNGMRSRDQRAQYCLAEALNWLLSQGLLSYGTPGQSSAEAIFVTRAGKTALADGLDRARAGARLSIDVHPRLRAARSQFLLGEFEIAAFAAMREVEIQVRTMADLPDSLIGVKLMRQALKPEGGPLADSDLDPGEQVGLMELFAGAIGTFKNPPSHRQVDYADPTEASEVLLLADLLMRLLDRSRAD